MTKETYLILHNIRSLHNIGSIFRTADGSGVKKIYLTGYTSAPVDIFGKHKKEIKKTALGAEKTVAWKKYKDINKLISKINNYQNSTSIVGVEQTPNAINYKKFRPQFPIVLIFGNEVRGLSKQTLNKCDKIIEIPMHGNKESLNVSVATGIILFDLVHRTIKS